MGNEKQPSKISPIDELAKQFVPKRKPRMVTRSVTLPVWLADELDRIVWEQRKEGSKITKSGMMDEAVKQRLGVKGPGDSPSRPRLDPVTPLVTRESPGIHPGL